MQSWHNTGYSTLKYWHVFMRPLDNVLHLHFKLASEAGYFLWRMGLLQFKHAQAVSNDRGNGSGYSTSWKGLCWNWIDPPQLTDAYGGTLMRREIEQLGSACSLIATYGHFGCTHHLLRHELAHSVWNSVPVYRSRVQRIVAKLSPPLRQTLLQALGRRGYVDSNVPLTMQKDKLDNELQAFIYCGERFTPIDGFQEDKMERELAYHRAQLYEAMECHYPALNHVGMMKITHWRTIDNTCQAATYPVWIGKECVNCDRLDMPINAGIPTGTRSGAFGVGRIHEASKEEVPMT